MCDPQFLTLLRHASAEPWVPGGDDFGREVNARGERHMAKLVHWSAQHLPQPSAALCSPAQRARGTLAPFAAIWPELDRITRFVPEIYEATPGTLHALAGEALAAANDVMMVGHNPGLEALARGLLRHDDPAQIGKMAPGTLVVIEFPGGWARDAGSGVLRHWLNKSDLA